MNSTVRRRGSEPVQRANRARRASPFGRARSRAIRSATGPKVKRRDDSWCALRLGQVSIVTSAARTGLRGLTAEAVRPPERFVVDHESSWSPGRRWCRGTTSRGRRGGRGRRDSSRRAWAARPRSPPAGPTRRACRSRPRGGRLLHDARTGALSGSCHRGRRRRLSRSTRHHRRSMVSCAPFSIENKCVDASVPADEDQQVEERHVVEVTGEEATDAMSNRSWRARPDPAVRTRSPGDRPHVPSAARWRWLLRLVKG